MIIKKLEMISFGKFENKTIIFDDKFNLIYGENESGKSTICAFITFMLYGKLAKKNTESKRILENYFPWNKNDFIKGAMVFEYNGKLYRVYREYRTSLKTEITNEIIGEKVDIFDNVSLGYTLFGVDSLTFEQSAFIKQSELKMQTTEELSQKLRSLVSGADENTSYEKAIDKLDNAKRLYFSEASNSNSSLQKLNKAIAAIENDLSKSEEAMRKYDEYNEETERVNEDILKYEKKLNEYDEQYKLHDANEAKSILLKAEEILLQKQKVEKLIDETNQVLWFEGHEAEKEYTNDVNMVIHDLLLAEQSLNTRAMLLEGIDLRIKENEAEINKIRDIYDNAQNIRLSLEEDKNSGSQWRFFMALGGTLATVISIVSYFLFGRKTLLLITACVCLAFALGMFLLNSLAHKRNDNSLLKKYGLSIDELIKKLNIAQTLKAKADELSNEYNLCKSTYETVENDYKNKMEKLKNLCLLHGRKITSFNDAQMFVKSLEQAQNTNNMLKNQKEGYISKLNIILGNKTLDEIKVLAENASETDIDFEQLETERKKLISLITDLKLKAKELSHNKEQLFSNLSFPDELATSLKLHLDRRAQLKEKAQSLNLAYKMLENAYNKMQDRFAPQINKKAGEILSVFTKNKYSKLYMNIKNEIKLDDNSNIRQLSLYSAGTNDIIYFAVRLAVVFLIFSDNLPPIIIDDSFSRVDKHRLKQIFQYLSEISIKSQIILFTCREEEFNLANNLANLLKI